MVGLFDLSGKVALVTGANTGIGQGIALALAEAGADIAAAGRSPATETVDKVEALGRKGENFAADLSSVAAVQPLVDAVLGEFGRIDILVNNAGIIRRADAVDFTEEDWDAVMDTNLKTLFFLCQAVGRHMIARGRGKIINICSVQSELGRPGIAPYAASKGAVRMLTRGMCADWARHGLQVNGLAPGYFATEMNRALVEDAAFSDWLCKRTPAG